MYSKIKRLLDIAISLFIGVTLLPIACIIALAIRLESDGPAIFWSDRVGMNNNIFRMPKFRTMNIDTPAVATDKLQSPTSHVTKSGKLLRRISLDEIPQFWSVIKGDMSLVGPRPALFNQSDLIKLRTDAGVHAIQPGITGWAQINGRDAISLERKVCLDKQYLSEITFLFDMKILWLTLLVVIRRKSVSH